MLTLDTIDVKYFPYLTKAMSCNTVNSGYNSICTANRWSESYDSVSSPKSTWMVGKVINLRRNNS